MRCKDCPAYVRDGEFWKCLLKKHIHTLKDGSHGCRTLTSTIMKLMKERDSSGKIDRC